MVISINQSQCSGCGICLDGCPNDAIQLVNGYAQINQELCLQCEACISVCPTGAIVSQMTVPQKESTALVIPQPSQDIQAKTPPPKQPIPWTTTILTLLTSDILPKLTDLVFNIINQRAKPSPEIQSSKFTRHAIQSYNGQPLRIRRRAQNRFRRSRNF